MTLFALMFACSTPDDEMMNPAPDAAHTDHDKDGHGAHGAEKPGHGHDHGDEKHGHAHGDDDGHAHEHDHAGKDGHGHDHGAGGHGHEHEAMGVAKMMDAPAGAAVMFGALKDGAKVASPVKVMMKVEGMTVQPAGAPVEGTGHHHLIIDGEGPEKGMAVPADVTHIHFGKGQTEAEVELAPGDHTLTLQFADGLHRSYGPALSKTIKVTVTP